jgi:hypothetical protein
MSRPAPTRLRGLNRSARNASPRARGSLTAWIDPGMAWPATASGMRVGPQTFSGTAIQACHRTAVPFGTPIRADDRLCGEPAEGGEPRLADTGALDALPTPEGAGRSASLPRRGRFGASARGRTCSRTAGPRPQSVQGRWSAASKGVLRRHALARHRDDRSRPRRTTPRPARGAPKPRPTGRSGSVSPGFGSWPRPRRHPRAMPPGPTPAPSSTGDSPTGTGGETAPPSWTAPKITSPHWSNG